MGYIAPVNPIEEAKGGVWHGSFPCIWTSAINSQQLRWLRRGKRGCTGGSRSSDSHPGKVIRLGQTAR